MLADLDPDALRWLLLGAIALVLVAMFLVVRFVQKVAVKLVLFAVLAALGLSLWVQRVELADCAATCSCSLYGRDVEVPDNRACA